MAKIFITRGKTGADKLRKYNIRLDGQFIGTIKQGESFSHEITPGYHKIYLRIDWCRSKVIRFQIEEGETANFHCHGLRGWQMSFLFLYGTFLFARYINLELEKIERLCE
jgi:hypothetical protein